MAESSIDQDLKLAVAALKAIDHESLFDKGFRMANKGHGQKGKYGHLISQGNAMIAISRAAKAVQENEQDW